MQQFKIPANGFKEIRKKSLSILIPFFLVLIIIAAIIIYKLPGNDKATQSQLKFIIIILILFIAASIYRSLGRQKKILESYTLTIDKNLVSTEQMRVPKTTIYFNDISQIIKDKKGSFTIKSSASKDVIIVPAQIEKYAEVELLLNQVKPITAASKS